MRARACWIAVVLVLAGCASPSSLDGFALPETAQSTGATYFVQHQPNDARGFDELIAVELRRRGLDARSADGEPADDVDYVVRYIDRWYWDMRTYLIDLRIDVLDAETRMLIATARSYQTSLPAMGMTHASVIERAVDVLIEGIDEAAADSPGSGRRSKRSRY